MKMGITNMAMSLSLMLLLLIVNFSEVPGQAITSSTFQPGRNLVEGENASQPRRGSDNTVRPDPLDNLKKYRGGYDITNKHYWSSTAYTGIPGYVIGALWLLCGIVYAVFLVVSSCCRRTRSELKKKKKRSSCHKQCYKWHVLLATFFTLLAIVGTGLVLGGNAKFHSRAKTILDIIIDTADDASKTIYNMTRAMKVMSSDLAATGAAATTSRFLTSTSRQLDSRADDIQRQARNHRHAINLGLRIVYIVTTFIISLNLVAVIALSVFGILKLRRAVYVLITFCWLIMVLCWFFFGLYFFIGKFAGDTCTAFEDFRQDPYNNSLSSILPCDELVSARSALSDVGAGVYNLVNEVNANISRLQADSYIKVCNPFSGPPQHNYEPNNCSDNAIPIGNIPEMLRLITCIDPANGVCNGGIPITNRDFTTVEAYTSSIQNLLNVYPGMESLVQCETVKDAFTEILNKHCKPVKRYVRMVWASMAFLSSVMLVLVLVWTVTYHDHWKHQFSDGSVKPHLDLTLPTTMPEAGQRREDNKLQPIRNQI